MKILIIGMMIAGLGILPVYVYSGMIQPQLDELRATYSSFDETAQDIADGKDYKTTKTYDHAGKLAESQ